MKKFKVLLSFFLLVSMCPSPLFAQDTGVSGTNLNFFTPSIDPYGFFGVNSPKLMRAGDFYFKLSQDIAGPHLFEVSVGGTPTDILDKIVSTHFLSSVGISNFLTTSLDIPFYLYARESNVTSLQSFKTESLGDFRMSLKLRILEDQPNKPFPGLALLITNTFPTGNEMKFLGTSHVVPGVELLVGKEFKFFSVATNFGANFPQSKTILGLKFDDQITYGGALKIPFGFWDPKLSVMGEIRGHFEPNKIQIVTAPIEFTAGLQKEFKNGLTLQAAGGGAWNNAIGNPRIRGLLTLAYNFSVNKNRQQENLDKKNQNISKVISFDFNTQHPSRSSEEELVHFLETYSRKNQTWLIEGHTDSSGPQSYNLRLARKRAETIKKKLIQKGIKPEDVEIKAYGETQPVSSNKTKKGRQQNRRVEIRF